MHRLTAIVLAIGLLGLLSAATIIGIIVWQNSRPVPFDKGSGGPLPITATDLRSYSYSGFGGFEYFASAKMPETDFLAWMRSLGLERNPELLKQYPLVLSGPSDLAWWPKNEAKNADVFFGLCPGGFIAARYETGRFYFRRSLD